MRNWRMTLSTTITVKEGDNMNLSAEEKLMYAVMNAIYSSGIPIDFKGAMVLKACLMEAGFPDEIRHTADIDANWYSDSPPSAEKLVESLETALQKTGINLQVDLYRMYGEGRSAGFELTDPDTGEILFTMDIDVNRPVQPTQIYEVAGLRFRGVSPDQMLADKISAISTGKVFRRIKDVVDLYYLSQVFEFDLNRLQKTLSNSDKMLEDFHGFLHGIDDLRHAYEKFRFTGGVNKPPFDEVYVKVKTYLKNVLPMDVVEEHTS